MKNIFKQREELTRENKHLKEEVEFLRAVKEGKEERIEELEARAGVIEPWDNSIPQDGEKRTQYMADITIHYNNVMKDQILAMVDEQKDALSKLDVSDTFTQIYRSNINCLLLLKGFYERCQTEYLGTLQERREDYKN